MAVTDRAHRYRAEKAQQQTERRCIYCGAPEAATAGGLVNDHIDGIEAHGNPENLALACKSCNAKKGALYARIGRGRRVPKNNPARPASNLWQWIEAARAVTGRGSSFSVADAQAMIDATPPDRRASFARESWRARKRIYGPSGRAQMDIPF